MKAEYSFLLMVLDKSNRIPFIVWIIVLGLSCYFIYNNAFRYFDINDISIHNPGFKPITLFLMVQILGGMFALVIVPVQFIAILRDKYKHFHRTIDKIFFNECLDFRKSIYLSSVFCNILRIKDFTFGIGLTG